MSITKIKGHIYVDNLNVDLIESLIGSYKTNQEFLKEIGFSDIVLINIRHGGKVRIETIDKFLALFPELEPRDLILDYNEEQFNHFDIDLSKYKPKQEDLDDCEKAIKAIVHSINSINEALGLEKKNKVYYLLKRLVLEANYYGVLLEKMNRSTKVIKAIEKVRNNND